MSTNDRGDPSPPAESWPAVSVIMPVFKEETHLRSSVRRVLEQRYPGTMEVVLAVAPSPDLTESIAAELAAEDARVRIVANPSGRTPAGLNAAIAASRHDILVRVDGHGELSPGYIERAVSILARTGAANVGGLMDAQGRSPLEQAAAAAMRSAFGIGAAPFHTGGKEGPSDSVYLGVFRRDVLDRLGGFDESFHRAQDWELNYRIRQAGDVVWFAPELTVVYRPRSTLREVAEQFRGSGAWRRQIVRLHPDTADLRYLAAPIAVLLLASGAAMGVVGVTASNLGRTPLGWLRLGWFAPLGYAGLLIVGGAVASRGLPARARLLTPVVMGTMHLSWGWGFLRGDR